MANLTLTMGGDINFNKNLYPVYAQGYKQGNSLISWQQLTQYIRPYIDGDINFANIETVITDRNNLAPQDKAFVFRTHPNGIQHLISIGYNLFNLANNHTYDYGHEGIAETLRNAHLLKNQNPEVTFFGLGRKQDVLRPTVFQKNGYTIAVASLSIMDTNYVATDLKPGMIHVWNRAQYYELIGNFKSTPADYKVLSIHFGKEGKITLDQGQKDYYEYAVKKGDVDLIIGHHPHAVRPIQKIGDKYIFYSLGNYLMLGSANITGLPAGREFGLFSKLHLVRGPTGRLKPEAIQLIALTNTHFAVKPLLGLQGQQKLKGLVLLNQSELKSEALPMRINTQGIGLYCETNLKLRSSQEVCSIY